MRLCALLGVPSRDALKRILTHRDYLDWLALYREDPWDQDRADLRAGIVAAAGLAPYSKPGRQPKPADFMPYAKRPRGITDPEQMKTLLNGIAPRWNAQAEKAKAKHGN